VPISEHVLITSSILNISLIREESNTAIKTLQSDHRNLMELDHSKRCPYKIIYNMDQILSNMAGRDYDKCN
jgi:hypothetical protein